MSTSRLIAVLLTLAGALSHGQAQDAPAGLAPDGHAGLGTLGTARELGRIFQKPDEAQAALLRGLSELDSDVRILAEMVRRSYLERGYFRLLGRYEPRELQALGERFLQPASALLDFVASGSEEADAWVDMYLDLRFRARLPLLASFAQEAREVQAGLALLRGQVDGYVELKDSEARAIADRIDLSAALLRAIRLDLEALRERDPGSSAGEAEPGWKVELIGLSKLRDEDARLEAFARLEAKVGERLERMESVLFWRRLVTRLDPELQRRDLGRERASQHLDEVKLYMLELPEGVSAPRELLQMTQFARYQHALSEALKGLGAAPFDEELLYRTGLITDLLYDTQESRQWFDRYLALRGVRLHLYRTTERELSEEEGYALRVLMRGGPVPGR
jgi:hypothetical protein